MNSPFNNLTSTENIVQDENIQKTVQPSTLDCEENNPTTILEETEESNSIKSAVIGNFQEKCGEIYVENGKYYLSCQFCTVNHDNLNLFIQHISTEHLVLHNDSEDSEDDDNNNCCQTSDSESEENLQLNKIIATTLSAKNNGESFINNYYDETTTGNLDMLSYDDDNDYNNIQKPENISCEPDTGIFFHDDLSDNSNDESNNIYDEMSQMHLDIKNETTDWNGLLTTSRTTGNNHSSINDNNGNGMVSIDGRYYCGFCEKNYGYSKSLKEHIDIIHKKSEKQFKCPTCDKAFSKQWKLNTHLKVHTDERPFVCSLCVMSFKWKKNLQRHLIRVHSVKYSDLVYEMRRDNSQNTTSNNNSNIIQNSFLTSNQNEQYPIIKNLLLTTSNQSPPTTSTANHSIKLETNVYDNNDSELNTNNYFTNNLYNINPFDNNQINNIDENIPISTIKNETFNNVEHNQLLTNNYDNNTRIGKIPNFLNNQLNIKSSSSSTSLLMNNDGMYACRLCDKVYVRKDSLRSHEKIHTSGLICNICDKPFTHQYFLDRHMKTHKSILNNRTFICNVCSDILPDESSLRRHVKFHFKKTYSCRCGTVFNLRKDYRSHRKLCRAL